LTPPYKRAYTKDDINEVLPYFVKTKRKLSRQATDNAQALRVTEMWLFFVSISQISQIHILISL
jgi:hypothetical protein